MSENSAVCAKLVVALNIIVVAVLVVDSLLLGSSRYLIVIAVELIFSKNRSATVSDTDSSGSVSIDVVNFNFGEGTPSQDNACSLVLHDLIFRNVSSRIKNHNAITVVVNFVLYDPSKSSFNSKDALTTAFTYLVTENSCVTRHVSSKSDVGFVIHFNAVFLNMGVSRLNEEDTLTIVLHDFIVLNHNCCKVRSFNPCQFILCDCQVFLYSGVVIFTSTKDAVTFILGDSVKSNNGITS